MSNNEYFSKLKLDFNQIIIDKSEITETKNKLGSGKFAKVFIGQYKGNNIAIKKFELDRDSVNKFIEKDEEFRSLSAEINSMLMLNSSRNCAIPELYGIVLVEEQDEIWYIMQKIEGINLKEFIENEKSIPISRKVRISWKICEVMEYIHKKGLIHRDLKPENVMINQNKDDEVYIIDFGLCKLKDFSKEFTRTGVKGSPLYSSPENFQNIESSGFGKGAEINFKADVWSFGCVMYELFSKKMPWEERYKTIKADHLSSMYFKNLKKITQLFIPNEFKENNPMITEIISNCTLSNVSERYTMSQAKQAIIEFYYKNFLEFTNSDTYLGYCLKDTKLYELSGNLTENDINYEGEFYNGKKSGFGIERNSSNNSIYIGEWKVDCWDGYGEYEITLENGNKNVFNWRYRNDLAIGKFINSDENYLYEGEFDKTDPYGLGSYQDLKNGKEYLGIGSWYIPSIEIGVCLDKNKDQIYEGYFSGVDYEGYGKLVDNPSKTVFEGEFKEGKKCGYGMLFDLNNNLLYEGQWENDIMHGEGVLYKENKIEFKGKFFEGEKQC